MFCCIRSFLIWKIPWSFRNRIQAGLIFFFVSGQVRCCWWVAVVERWILLESLDICWFGSLPGLPSIILFLGSLYFFFHFFFTNINSPFVFGVLIIHFRLPTDWETLTRTRERRKHDMTTGPYLKPFPWAFLLLPPTSSNIPINSTTISKDGGLDRSSTSRSAFCFKSLNWAFISWILFHLWMLYLRVDWGEGV